MRINKRLQWFDRRIACQDVFLYQHYRFLHWLSSGNWQKSHSVTVATDSQILKNSIYESVALIFIFNRRITDYKTNRFVTNESSPKFTINPRLHLEIVR